MQLYRMQHFISSPIRRISILSLLLIIFTFNAIAQKNSPKNYPSLFWEITGNGLTKPSYLFGTMHVSSKMAFHLSDSFYHAIRNVDAVALELNPELWQQQMVHLELVKYQYAQYLQEHKDEVLTERTFRFNTFIEELKLALSTEPTVVNSLLYRNYATKADFEEDTFLDLYIYQTGKKLGKRATGVENFYESEKIILEAYADMAKEKKKKTYNNEEESISDIRDKIENAYKNGDLDLMDSLDNLIEQSPAFREKFLYKRNDIQAASIDTILKKSSLFVGVGAAHLPGKRGVIEILRKLGYKLRPIKMLNRDAEQKEAIDKMKVPVIFTTVKSHDDLFTVEMPGPLFKTPDELQLIDRRQYADMSNGSYYMVSRLTTRANFLGMNAVEIKKKTDSLLYENIPGKIITKRNVVRNGYPGFDITNRTRRGDLQRYHIYFTPFEVIIFKMSGRENYLQGAEGDKFFSSIRFRENIIKPTAYEPAQGGFSINFPHEPHVRFKSLATEQTKQWEYEAFDPISKQAYLLIRKPLYQNFIEEDSFDLQLMEESFHSGEFMDHQISRKIGTHLGFPCLDVLEKMKDSSIIQARFVLQGPNYYVLAVRAPNANPVAEDYFQSLRFTPNKYGEKKNFTDTFLHFNVSSFFIPNLDDNFRDAVEQITKETENNNKSYWPNERYANFTNDSTGESISINIKKYPKYYYVIDSTKFWDNEIESLYDTEDLILVNKTFFERKNGSRGFSLTLRDTAISRELYRLVVYKDQYRFILGAIGDTLSPKTPFIQAFFDSFSGEDKFLGKNIFMNCLDSFFTDLKSTDSATHANAQNAISYIHFGEIGLPKIMKTLASINQDTKDYYDTKTKLIAELGYIKDTTSPKVVQHLKQLYELTADTTMFQNEVLEALARHQTTPAIKLFKELVLQDPPVYDDEYGYESLFELLSDSLKLAAPLYPELLQLTTLDDYKEQTLQLLTRLIDSGLVKKDIHEPYFGKIYFDAKIALKKLQGADEKKLEVKDEDEDDEPARNYDYSDQQDELDKYARLLMPFYDKNPNVPRFFEKLLRSKDDNIRLSAAITMLKNQKSVPDSILTWYAAKDNFRARLYTELKEAKQLSFFPKKYNNQLDITRSMLVRDKNFEKMDSVVYLYRQEANNFLKTGWVYFYKYRVKKEDDWKIGVAGLQPLNLEETDDDQSMVSMTDKKLKTELTEKEQFTLQLKKMIFEFRKGGAKFYNSNNIYDLIKQYN